MRFKFILKATALLVLLASFTGTANAEGRFGIGVSVGVGNFDTSGTETEGGNIGAADTSVMTANESQAAALGNIFVEYAAQFGNFGATLGISTIPGTHSLGKRVREDISNPVADLQDTGDYTAKASVSDHVGYYLEPTYYFPGTESGIYLKLGALRTTVTTEESLNYGINSSTYGNDTVWGSQVGIGLRSRHSSGFFTKFEYSETDYDALKFTSTTGNLNSIAADIDAQMFTVGLGWSF